MFVIKVYNWFELCNIYHPHHCSAQLLHSKGEAMRYAKWAHLTASPLRGEAGRSNDEGGKEILMVQKCKVNNTLSPTPPPREGVTCVNLTQQGCIIRTSLVPSLGGGVGERVLLTLIYFPLSIKRK